ncbi:uncharacterized protein BYT42DRAFT_568823 [Radiomyces spectabilis]|uniref:uncharacterized protein n=1 Tax=Radiomyces spectabilis TaxID=64574 RepID=UPI002220F823|nr:uncharacterized protein BYT42DRAFT_568823 [Radiomyces spectabilis]KAI8379444.1 hypothetical protein BYT42DRAFT_568823 [Radiomyces spectabilis]
MQLDMLTRMNMISTGYCEYSWIYHANGDQYAQSKSFLCAGHARYCLFQSRRYHFFKRNHYSWLVSDSSSYLLFLFSSRAGFLTAIVFFTDPAIRTYMTEELNDWRSQYFNKYSRIETYEEGQGIRFSLTEGASSLVSAKSTKKQGHAPVSCKHHFIAMYRMNIPSASYSRLCRNPKHLVISTASCDDGWSKTVICHMRTKECNRTFCFSDDITDEIYIPYRFPRLVHFVRSACKCLRLAPSKPIEPSTPISYYAQTKSFDDNSWTVSSNNSCESRHPSEL